ncbi:hypothetical protein LZ318_12635 [Saccharopolyspora indica]|uniref:hypothetical protein n=1 Tax=Saccharopolyspora indica TaxID=1229659 RepID=UPI0022EA6E32|nr:hypothetical protein [Saccharopolyspora indica]MDA3643642.1 hypothetical protein [Saccharopolyspora indica]
MSATIRRLAAVAATAITACLLTGGVATAEPIWLLPGVDVGPLLEPSVQLPTQLLAPVFDVLNP